MSAETVRNWLAAYAPDLRIIDNGLEVATVAEAAAGLNVEPSRIAKTLALRVQKQIVLVVARGDARLDNAKCKLALGGRPRFLNAEETLRMTGHPVGGVCPFGLAVDLSVYCDVSLRGFVTVYPAAGSRTASIAIAPDRLCALTASQWIDVCRTPDETNSPRAG